MGLTSTQGYTFERSKGLKGDQFLELALGIESQADKTVPRIANWVAQLKKEFN